jgi:small subunit ribosomal protein S20
MANSIQAKKRIRQIERRTAVNRVRRTRMRTFVRRVEEAIESGDKTAAEVAMRNAEPQLIRAAQKGLLHANAASRKVSRLNKRLNAMTA